jgi:hypothetical protein
MKPLRKADQKVRRSKAIREVREDWPRACWISVQFSTIQFHPRDQRTCANRLRIRHRPAPHEALCRQSSTTLDIVHAEDGPPITQRTSGLVDWTPALTDRALTSMVAELDRKLGSAGRFRDVNAQFTAELLRECLDDLHAKALRYCGIEVLG